MSRNPCGRRGFVTGCNDMGRPPIGTRAMTTAERQRRHRLNRGASGVKGMAQAAELFPTPPTLPATTEDYLVHRKLTANRAINDHVEDVHLRLIEDESYAALLFAIYDEQAVEKSLDVDDVMAAQKIREKAVKEGNSDLAHESLAAIIKALHVVLRRYGFSRIERRNMVGGQVVTPEADEQHKPN